MIYWASWKPTQWGPYKAIHHCSPTFLLVCIRPDNRVVFLCALIVGLRCRLSWIVLYYFLPFCWLTHDDRAVAHLYFSSVCRQVLIFFSCTAGRSGLWAYSQCNMLCAYSQCNMLVSISACEWSARVRSCSVGLRIHVIRIDPDWVGSARIWINPD